MKAEELRIGNLVQTRLRTFTEYTTEGVTASGLMDLYCNKENSSIEYKPIELTEYLFFNLGFDRGSDLVGECYFIECKTNDIVVYITDEGYKLGEYQIEIKYVHQLQNLYFSLTGEELKYYKTNLV